MATNNSINISTGALGTILRGAGVGSAPTFTTTTYPNTTTANRILYSSAANVIGEIVTAVDGVIITDHANGVPSILANGTAGYVLTAQSGAPPAWAAAAASGIITLNGNSGSATGSTVTITTGTGAGKTINFTGASSTLTLNTTDANDNVAYGNLALGNASGIRNAAFGKGALSSATGINTSAAFGYQALQLATGDSNVAFGPNAGQTLGDGTENTYIGLAAGYQNTGGNYNTIIGSQTGTSLTSTEASCIIIGRTATGTTGVSNLLQIGNGTGTAAGNLNSAFISGISGITVTSTAAVLVNTSTNQLGTVISSERFKDKIEDMSDASEFIYKLRPVKFILKSNPEYGQQTGLIAEEVFKIAPQLVCLDREGIPCAVSYHELPALILNELQKALKRIEILESKLSIL